MFLKPDFIRFNKDFLGDVGGKIMNSSVSGPEKEMSFFFF